jgi:hypothetical protein
MDNHSPRVLRRGGGAGIQAGGEGLSMSASTRRKEEEEVEQGRPTVTVHRVAQQGERSVRPAICHHQEAAMEQVGKRSGDGGM